MLSKLAQPYASHLVMLDQIHDEPLGRWTLRETHASEDEPTTIAHELAATPRALSANVRETAPW